MKNKNKILTFLVLLFIPFQSYGLFSDDIGFDFYTDIEDSFSDLEAALMKASITGSSPAGQGNSPIIDSLNESFSSTTNGNNCFKKNKDGKDMDLNDMKSIAGNPEETFDILGKYINDKTCNLTPELLINLGYAVKGVYDLNKELASQTVEEAFTTTKIGMYADNNTDNSSFDLIDDLERSNMVVFGAKLNYEGVNRDDYDEIFQCVLAKGNIEKCAEEAKEKRENKEDEEEDTDTEETPEVEEELIDAPIDDPPLFAESTFICAPENSTGLDDGVLGDLFNESESASSTQLGENEQCTTPSGCSCPDGTMASQGETCGIIGEDDDEKGEDEDDKNGKGADSDIFPCNEFFCITIEDVWYIQDTLGGGGDTSSIRYFIEESNEILGEKLSGSFVQSKMTINNFELGLKDMDFSEMFHSNFVFMSKPPPILNLDAGKPPILKKNMTASELKKELGKFAPDVRDSLASSFADEGLYYYRENDINELACKNLKNTFMQNSAQMSISDIAKKDEKLKCKMDEIIKYSKKVSTTIGEDSATILKKMLGGEALEKKAATAKNNLDSINELDKQFYELKSFIKTMKEYAYKLESLVHSLDSIPEGR